ncbi:MAG: hypothetical protein K2V38_22975 [Gemmataceae bacterium]|nr:hypothetical protein [Gemmataceae bacterium]
MRWTLPELVAQWGESLDRARETIRRDERLRALGVRIGPTRAFDENEAEVIRRALEARRAKKAGLVAAT